MNRDRAEEIAIAALGWLGEDAERLNRFCAATGIMELELVAQAGQPETLAALLDQVLSEDAWVMEVAEAAACRPEDLLIARQLLPGGDIPHWT